MHDDGNAAGTIRIAIVDNDLVTMHALSALLRRAGQFDIIWTAQTGRDALTLCLEDDRNPDVLLLDMGLSDMPGSLVCRRLRRNAAVPSILAITSYPLERYAAEAATSGAQGIIAKQEYHAIASAIRTLAGGGTIPSPIDLDPACLCQPADQAHGRLERERLTGIETLSYSEMQVLTMLAQGLTYQQIATKLNIAPVTVRTHASHARTKIGARTTGEALVRWTQHKSGLIARTAPRSFDDGRCAASWRSAQSQWTDYPIWQACP